MPRDNKQKIKLLYLMEILRQDTDEQHPISTNQICRRLSEQGISCERRTVGMDMKVLNRRYLDISRRSDQILRITKYSALETELTWSLRLTG